jgi:hypothetical protein
MRITFRRFPSGVDSYSEIERDDGAVFRMVEFSRGGARLPHDLRHLVVELELGVTDGIWGTIADGGMYTSMRFAGGRRLPHDAARKSDALTKARHHRLGRAELLANIAESIAALDSPTDAQVREIIRRHLAVVPLSEPGQDPARRRTPAPGRPRRGGGRRARGRGEVGRPAGRRRALLRVDAPPVPRRRAAGPGDSARAAPPRGREGLREGRGPPRPAPPGI